MKRKTRATPANTPRSRSKLTRRQRIYGYRVHKPEDRNPQNLNWTSSDFVRRSDSLTNARKNPIACQAIDVARGAVK